MTEKKIAGVYTLEHFGENVLAAFSGRQFPLKRVPDFLGYLGVDEGNLIRLKQVHSANLVLVSAENRPGDDCQADGMLTTAPGMALGVMTADCVPLFFHDETRKVVGIAHAGWRGIHHGITRKIIQAMRQNFASRPEDIRMAIGPAIRGCCYEVGEEFEEYFPEFYVRPVGKRADLKGRMDLIAAIRTEALDQGLGIDRIHDSGLCTVCRNDRFFSYRHEKRTAERILNLISLRAPGA